MTVTETPTIVQAVDHYDSPRVQTRIRARARRLSNVAVLAVAIGSMVTGSAAASTPSYGVIPGSIVMYASFQNMHVEGDILCPENSTWTIQGSVKQAKAKGNTEAGGVPMGHCGPGMHKGAFELHMVSNKGIFEGVWGTNTDAPDATVKLKSTICTMVNGKSNCKTSTLKVKIAGTQVIQS